MKKVRVLTVSKPYVAAAYRSKLRLMARDPRIELALVTPLQWAEQSFEGPLDHEFKTYRLPIVLNGKNHFHFYLGLDRVFEEFRPDILNIEEEHYSLVTLQGLLLARKHGAKSYFYTWQNISKKYPFPFSWIEQFVFREAKGAFAGNQEASDILRAKGFKKNIATVPQMGVDLERFAPPDLSDEHKRACRTELNLDPSKFWISYFGRLVPEKGLYHLVSAFTELKKNYSNLGLLIVGRGPEEKKLTEESKKTTDIVFKSFVPSLDVPKWLQAMDVLCLPSETRANWKEQFGRILIEAMASGTVVVGSNSGEIPHVIGKAGLVFQEQNAVALEGVLRKLIDRPSLWREFQEKGFQRVQANFTQEKVAQTFVDFMLA